jgi:hypothetical protein
MPLLRPTAVLRLEDLEGYEKPGIWRRIGLSLPAMAILTGASLRSYRALVLTYGWSDSWLWIGGTFIGGAMILFLMATLHLGNYPTRAWWWRAPVFALVEAATEIGVSLALTYLGLEVVGSMQATIEDWQVTSLRTLFFRFVGISLFALVLALVSTVVRLLLLKGREVTHQ